MKALIIKDFLLMQKQLKLMAGVMVLYAILFVPQGMADMLPFMLVMFVTLYAMTSMSFDETLKWDSYALSGPLTRNTVVNAKYIFSLLLVLCAFVLGMLCYALLPLFMPPPRLFMQSLAILCGICFAGLLWVSIMLPAMYKLGVEKSRLLMVAAIMLPVVAAVLYGRYAPPELTTFFVNHAAYVPPVLALLAIAACAASYKISLNIYSNKEF